MAIEFVIPTWQRPNELKVMLSCLQAQTNPNWSAHVIIDGLTNDYFEVKDIYQNEPRVKFSHVNGPNNDWGHTARNYGLQKCKEEWVVMTGDDNYYMPIFVDNFLKAANNKTHFVYCDMVHNNYNYQPIKCSVSYAKIDIGNFMSKTDYAKTIELDTTDYNADWKWIEKYISKYKYNNVIKIDKVLYVHN